MKITTRAAQALFVDRPPLWRLGYLDVATHDARDFLDEDQYAHVVHQFDDLAAEVNPVLSRTQQVKPIDGFYELREKGGILGRINFRAYFVVLESQKMILVLACYKKEDDGQTPTHIRVKVRHRLRYALSMLG